MLLSKIHLISTLTGIAQVILILVMPLIALTLIIVKTGQKQARIAKQREFDMRLKQLQVFTEFCLDSHWKKGLDGCFEEISKMPEAKEVGNYEKLQVLEQDIERRFAEKETFKMN